MRSGRCLVLFFRLATRLATHLRLATQSVNAGSSDPCRTGAKRHFHQRSFFDEAVDRGSGETQGSHRFSDGVVERQGRALLGVQLRHDTS
jgi:hypothetical protein